MIVGGVDVGGGGVKVAVGGSGVNVLVGVKVLVGVGLGPRVRVGTRVSVGTRVLDGVAEGARTRVGVASTWAGYNSNMAEYQSSPLVRTNSVKRVPAL